jgi:hypothetical protein
MGHTGDLVFLGRYGEDSSNGIFRVSTGITSAVVIRGDIAPGTGGQPFFSFLDASVGANGDLVFVASYGERISRTETGIFRYSGGIVTALVLEGDIVPGTGGQTLFGLWAPAVGLNGDVVFLGQYVDLDILDSVYGVFRLCGGSISTVAVNSDIAPESGGQSFTRFQIQNLHWYGMEIKSL